MTCVLRLLDSRNPREVRSPHLTRAARTVSSVRTPCPTRWRRPAAPNHACHVCRCAGRVREAPRGRAGGRQRRERPRRALPAPRRGRHVAVSVAGVPVAPPPRRHRRARPRPVTPPLPCPHRRRRRLLPHLLHTGQQRASGAHPPLCACPHAPASAGDGERACCCLPLGIRHCHTVSLSCAVVHSSVPRIWGAPLAGACVCSVLKKPQGRGCKPQPRVSSGAPTCLQMYMRQSARAASHRCVRTLRRARSLCQHRSRHETPSPRHWP